MTIPGLSIIFEKFPGSPSEGDMAKTKVENCVFSKEINIHKETKPQHLPATLTMLQCFFLVKCQDLALVQLKSGVIVSEGNGVRAMEWDRHRQKNIKKGSFFLRTYYIFFLLLLIVLCVRVCVQPDLSICTSKYGNIFSLTVSCISIFSFCILHLRPDSAPLSTLAGNFDSVHEQAHTNQ